MMATGHTMLNTLLDLAGQDVGGRAAMLVAVIFIGSGLFVTTVMALSRLYGWIWQKLVAIVTAFRGGRR